MNRKAVAKFITIFFSVNKWAKITLMLFVAMPNSTLIANFQLNTFDFDFFLLIIRLFCLKKYAKTAMKVFVTIPNCRLSTNFMLDIFLFGAALPSLKQKSRKSAQLGNKPN